MTFNVGNPLTTLSIESWDRSKRKSSLSREKEEEQDSRLTLDVDLVFGFAGRDASSSGPSVKFSFLARRTAREQLEWKWRRPYEMASSPLTKWNGAQISEVLLFRRDPNLALFSFGKIQKAKAEPLVPYKSNGLS
jgi:hypothetical protein